MNKRPRIELLRFESISENDFTPLYRHAQYNEECVMKREHETEKLAKQLQAIREKKIRKLKAKLSEGRYEVQNAKIARNLFISNQ